MMQKHQAAIRRLDQYIELRMQAANTPGIAIAVTDREDTLHLASYGYADLAAQEPLTEDTLFEVGSISKSFTSLVLMQLQEEGELDLHQPVTRYLPWFEVQSEHGPITIHHLMSHTAGIIRGMEFTGEARYEVWALRETQAIAPPGTYYHYSNVGYKALGVLLEDILARTYGEIIQERILDPLGMTKTDPVISHDTRRRLAVGYEAFYDDRPPPRERPLAPATWLEYRWGDGSVAATAKDMSTYLRMYLNRGLGPEEAILSQESIDLMMAPVIDAIEEERDISYGFGLDVEELEGRKIIGHGGGMVGYYAQILADMQDGLGVVVLANAPGSETHQIATYALDLLRAALHDDPLPSLPRVDLSLTDSAEDYVGKYQRQQCSPRSLTPGSRDAVIEAFWIRAADRRLLLEIQDESIQLEMREPDYFFADHPNFAPYLLRFGRHDDKVVEVCSGPDWYVNERYNGPQKFDSPSDWDAYPGHYRSHNPWDTNFRVVLRKGGLKLIYPSGKEEPLVPVGGGEFRVGANDVCPERIRFDVIVDGQALRANLSCAEYFRTSRF